MFKAKKLLENTQGSVLQATGDAAGKQAKTEEPDENKYFDS